MNCGTDRKEPGNCCSEPVSDLPKTVYPSFAFTDEKADEFQEATPVQVDDVLEITGGKLKVSATEDGQFGKRLTFDVLELEVKKTGEEPPADEDAKTEGESEADGMNPAMRKMMAKMLAKGANG